MKPRLPIVIIEDDAMIRDGLREFLEFEGFQTATAGNGQEGLDLLRRQGGACLVILDLQMPVMTGEQLMEALKMEPDPVLREVPVLVLSARAEEFKGEGIVGFMRKPCDLDALLKHVTCLCA